MIVFEGPAQGLVRPIIPIKDGNFAPQGPVYVKWDDLEGATCLDDALRPDS